MKTGGRFARLATDVVVRRPALWRVFRRPLARMFDAMAPSWDGTRVTPQHLEPLAAALDRLDAPPSRILDLGTGTGAAARVLAQRYPEALITGVDLSPQMIREAEARATSDRERYVTADASALPFGDDAFELVVLLNMIPFYDELARVTAPGGAAVLAYSRGPETPIWVPLRRSRDELERRGFDRFEEVTAGAGCALVAWLHCRRAAR
jgi:ubiquinone/menaquinone biosynthesis C-methylase UbiE